MELIEGIRRKIAEALFEFSRRALDQSLRRRISVDAICAAIATGEVIEDYPGDKYGPSCLLLGHTSDGRALHIQCSYPSRSLVKLITVYEPDPEQWQASRERKPGR